MTARDRGPRAVHAVASAGGRRAGWSDARLCGMQTRGPPFRGGWELDEARSTPPEAPDEHADDRHEVELAAEHLDDREGPADGAGRGQVPEAGRGQHGEAEVHAGALR